MDRLKIIVTTHPFTKSNKSLIELDFNGYIIKFNPHYRKMSSQEHIEFLKEEQPDIIIAGTELYTKDVLKLCPNLKMISRVGIGLDSVDLEECKKLNIKVTNTPDAPTNAVAEMTIGQMITLSRSIHKANNDIKNEKWIRYIGKELSDCKIGIFGCGRIGKSVITKLSTFFPKSIYINDIILNKVQTIYEISTFKYDSGVRYINTRATKEEILKECDIISIHIPLNEKNKNFISNYELNLMKNDAILINNSRGGIINEGDLFNWLNKNPNASAAIDVFETEPYIGEFTKLNNVLLTPHMGSCSKKSRKDMEQQSVKNVIDFLNND